MTLSIANLPLSSTLVDELAAVVDTGFYADAESFLSDAIHTLLAARPELRVAVACSLYAREIFSLGKAAEWSGLTIEAMKEALHKQHIDRSSPETVDEIEKMARLSLDAAGRSSAQWQQPE